MNTARFAFHPALAWSWLALLLMAVLLAVTPALARRARGAALRCLGFLLLLAVLIGPVWLAQTRRPLPDIAVLLVDRSQSMRLGDRAALAAVALRSLRASAADIDLHVVDVAPTTTGGTTLFAALQNALAAIPPAQLAGIIGVTDGEVFDTPASFPTLPPFTALLTAQHAETDRELRLLDNPGYGLVGQFTELHLKVLDHGTHDTGAPVIITVTENGQTLSQRTVQVGVPMTLDLPVRHAGPNIVQASVTALPGEISPINNQTVLTLNGIQKRLNVLLISGSPDLGERSWRVLLKSDPATQLVHFTILRTPGEAINADPTDLALVPFPVRQLFGLDLNKFDLIILDRFNTTGLLPTAYLVNIANYVRNGGALFAELGPEFSSPASLAFSPLGDILPAQPIDPGTLTQAFSPTVTPLGTRHPITAPLAAAPLAPWYRTEAATPTFGDVLMTGANNTPLLIVGAAGKGRVGMLLSDQFWLWTRGGAHAGPALPLLRRIVHWLLRDPALEQEALRAEFSGDTLTVDRQTLGVDPFQTVTVTAPDGTADEVALRQTSPGIYIATLPAPQHGVWKLSSAGLTTYVANPLENPEEYQDLAATAERLQPVASNIIWLGQTPTPNLSQLIRPRHASAVASMRDIPLTPPLPTMLLSLALLAAAWWRESR